MQSSKCRHRGGAGLLHRFHLRPAAGASLLAQRAARARPQAARRSLMAQPSTIHNWDTIELLGVVCLIGEAQWLAVSYLGPIASSLSFFLWVSALERMTSTRVASTRQGRRLLGAAFQSLRPCLLRAPPPRRQRRSGGGARHSRDKAIDIRFIIVDMRRNPHASEARRHVNLLVRELRNNLAEGAVRKA